MTDISPGRTVLTDRYSRAVDYARAIHAADYRKKTDIPYLAHLLAVSGLVLENCGDEDQAIAALLHDAAEDHGGQPRLDAIRAEFGSSVADIVAACSDSLVDDSSRKLSWWERKVLYLQRLEHEEPRAALVSCADKLHNARSVLGDYRRIGEELWTRFNPDAGRRGEVWYYRRLAEILPRGLGTTEGTVDGRPYAVAVDLERTVGEIRTAIAANPNAVDAEALEAEWEQSLAEEQTIWARTQEAAT